MFNMAGPLEDGVSGHLYASAAVVLVGPFEQQQSHIIDQRTQESTWSAVVAPKVIWVSSVRAVV
jgi:hypothetical protein